MRSRATAITVVLALVVFAALNLVPAQAANTVPFGIRYQANANGAIIAIGNNLLTCPDSAANCAAARAGGNYNNNSFTMTNLDADDVASTFNSSSSSLLLPDGAVVQWAGLYWGARLTAGSGGQAGTGTRTQMQLRPPGAAAYIPVASQFTFGPNTSSYGAYQEFADVTAIVAAGGNGPYWGANVVAATGVDRYAGWSLVVAYAAPNMPLRNLTVFDGFDMVSTSNPQTITIDGFLAPWTGPVDAQLSMVAYEGDLYQAPDYSLLNTTQLATALSPGSNFFNATNDTNGTSVTTRIPADKNMLGFDIKNIGASGAIPNGATSATFTFSSGGDTYYPGVLTTAISIYSPDFTTSTKSVINLSGNNPSRPGDTLQYTLAFSNTGMDSALQVVAEDALPPGVSFVPGSIRWVASFGVPPTSQTDAADGDRAEYDPTTRTVRARLGTSVTPAGGTMVGTVDGQGTGSQNKLMFNVVVDPGAGGTTVANQGTLQYRTKTAGVDATYVTNVASTDVVAQADVAVSKTMSPRPTPVGGQSVSTVTVTNNGPNDATGVVLTDPLPPGLTNVQVSTAFGVTCTIGATTVSCPLGTVANGASVTAVIRGTVPSGSTDTSVTNVATVSTTAYDPVTTNNVSSDTVSLVRQADLAITKSASASTAPPGAEVTYTITATNNGPSDATNVVVSDLLDPSQLALVSAVPSTGTCITPGNGLACVVPTLAVGASVSVTVTATLDSRLSQGTVVSNTAQVTSATLDPVTTNNQASSQVTVGAPQADIVLTKTAPADAVAGTSITYQLDATNDGPSDATNVVISDPPPAGVTFTSVSTTRGSCAINGAGAVACSGISLPAASSMRVTVVGAVAPDANPGPVTNTATATAFGRDTTASATTNVVRSFDLSVTKRANRSSLPAAAGLDVDYTITITNHGPSTATGVQLSDVVPAGLVVDAVTPAASLTCGSLAAVPLVCGLNGSIPPGGSQDIVVQTHSAADLSTGPDLTETVTVSATGQTPATASWTLTGSGQADLAVTKTAPAAVVAGTMVTYEITVENTNDPTWDDITALNVELTDTLPAGVTFLASTAPGSLTTSGCAAVGQDVTCALAATAPQTSTTVKISVLVDPGLAAGTTVVNTATVTSTTADPSLDNNSSTVTSQVETSTDLSVHDLTVTPAGPYTGAGSWVTVAFTITNDADGPSVAHDVQFRLDSVADLGVAVDPNRCAIANGEFVCTITAVDLAPGESVTETFDMVVLGYVEPGSYPVTVSTSTTTPETTLTNNTVSANLVVGAAGTALRATKSAEDTVSNPADGHAAYTAGTPFRYQVEVSSPNATPPAPYGADAQDVMVTDVLPAGFTATSVVSTQGTCSTGDDGTAFKCLLGTVPSYMPTAAAPVTITVIGMVASDTPTGAAGEQVDNVATVTSSTPDLAGNPTSLVPSVAVDIIAEADLRLIKNADSNPVYVGGQDSFTLTVVNAGPSVATNATVADTLPVGFDYVASPGCQQVGGTPATGVQVECTIAEVGLADSSSVRVFVSMDPFGGRVPGCRPGDPCDPVYPRTVTNTASVSAAALDPDLSNNAASVDVEADRLADHAIIGSVSTSTPTAGGQVLYSAMSINNGPSVADNPTGVTTFPPGFVPMASAPPDVPGNLCTWDPPAPPDPQDVAWSTTQYTLSCEAIDVPPLFKVFEPAIPVFSQVAMWIPADTPPGLYTTKVVVGTTTPESDYENNTSLVPVNVQQVSDLSVTKTLVDPMVAGRQATWRVDVTNAGPSVADNVVVADAVPEGMTFVSASVEGGAACSTPTTGNAESVVSCPVGRLGVGGSGTVLVTFAVPLGAAGTQQCNAVLVGSSSLDPDATNNKAEACDVPVLPPAADVGVAITQSTLSPDGQEARFLVEVTNNGPGDATSVVVEFDVPDGLTITSTVVAASSGATGVVGCTGRLVCTVDTIVPGGKVVYSIVGSLSPTAGSNLTLKVTVTHNEPDPVEANNTDSATLVLPGTSASADPPATMAATGAPAFLLFAIAAFVVSCGVWWLVVARRARQ
ncbi:MAG: hypothetical protein FWF02_02230 [Micrococcales bacterium]|nr:hypothetical protein [Micrococcales bacterium]